MQGFIAIIFIITHMAGGASAEPIFDYVGQIPEVVVDAPRYEYEDESLSGLLETVVVTAPRYEYEDDAWSGMVETVIVTASRYDGEDAHIASITNGHSNQSLGQKNIFTRFVHARIQIYLMVLGAILLIIVRFLIPSFLFKSRKPTDEVCYCEQHH